MTDQVMREMDDPAYITSLLDPDSNYSCYFCIGDPRKGPVERIGVVLPMLMAHSLVLRRALDVQKSELKEKWDIPVSDITPKTFKNVLRYAYGFNNIKNQSLPHSVELLALADRWVMKPMSHDLANHIASIITPVNVCLAMRDPICLRVKKVEEEISSLVKKNAMRVLTSPYLHLVCPAGMRYIVLLKSLRASDMDVWRAVMRWARNRVLKQNLMMNSHVDMYIHQKLIVPCRNYLKLCSLNMIDLVEEVLANHPDKEQHIEGIKKYHFIPVKPPRSLYVCTESKNAHHLKHEEFQVKVVHTCDAWVNVIYLLSSTLTITNNTENHIELYSIVCTSKQRLTHDLVEDHELVDVTNHALQLPTDFKYNISCLVKVTLVSGDEDVKESLITEVNFETEVVYSNDFQIPLSSKNERLLLQPNSSYKIETTFSKPHPLWYMSEMDYIVPGQSTDMEIGCGLVNKESHLFGSHVKFVLYRKSSQD